MFFINTTLCFMLDGWWYEEPVVALCLASWVEQSAAEEAALSTYSRGELHDVNVWHQLGQCPPERTVQDRPVPFNQLLLSLLVFPQPQQPMPRKQQMWPQSHEMSSTTSCTHLRTSASGGFGPSCIRRLCWWSVSSHRLLCLPGSDVEVVISTPVN